jgi:hypothetical protein
MSWFALANKKYLTTTFPVYIRELDIFTSNSEAMAVRRRIVHIDFSATSHVSAKEWDIRKVG